MDSSQLDLAAALRISQMAYEAVSDPAAWRRVMSELVKALGACAGGVHFRQRLPGPSWGDQERASQIWVGLEPEFEKAYMAGFWQEDPWAPSVFQTSTGNVLLPEEIIASRELKRTRFYNDLCRSFGYLELMCGPVVNDGEGTVVGAGFFRKAGQPPFGEEERAFLALLMPHLHRVTEVALRTSKGPPSDPATAPDPAPASASASGPDGASGADRGNGTNGTSGTNGTNGTNGTSGSPVSSGVVEGTTSAPDDLLDRLPVGAIAVDARGRVLRANRVARRIFSLADGLSIDVDGLRATRAADTTVLRRAIACATGGGGAAGGGTGEGGGLVLPRPSGRVPLSVTIAPIRPDSARALETPGAAAIVYVVDPEVDLQTSDALLRRLFGLTEAEARIARLVGDGRSPREAADMLGVAWNTARFQLRQVFAKTGVDRQPALARLLVLLGFARPM